MKQPKANISNVKATRKSQKVVTPRSDVVISSGKDKEQKPTKDCRQTAQGVTKARHPLGLF
jgi:hypothetical protein